MQFGKKVATVQGNMLLSSSEQTRLFKSEDSNRFFPNVGSYLSNYVASHPNTQ